MSWADTVVVIVALLVMLVSLLNPGGFFVGALLALAILAAWFGGQYLLELEKSRRMGERSGSYRDKFAGREDDDGKWRR